MKDNFKQIKIILAREFSISRRNILFMSILAAFLILAGYIFNSINILFRRVELFIFIKEMAGLGI
ncbi:MAG: hypothetical protein PHV06_10940, partial [bacterium]|nr:hypothetical protein [bacterium]